jgi:hypothetical protein
MSGERPDGGETTPTDSGAPRRPDSSSEADADAPRRDASVAPGANEDFAARCAGAGVLVCRGFDSMEELTPICCEWETGAEPDGNGTFDHMTIDREIRTSGDGALRFEIAGRTGSNHSGAFRQLIGQAFGPGEEFYAQFRLRLSRTFIETPWDAVVGSAPKIVIFHHSSATCNDIEWTQVMSGWYDHIASMYTHCGMYAPHDGTSASGYFQRGDYECMYGADYARDPSCLKYTPDEWMTFYFHTRPGEWGTPTTLLEAWVSENGEPYRKWIDDPAFTFYAEGDSVEGFDSVYLTTYMTAKDETADHATAYAWYDELIVSTEPLPVPVAP